MKHITNASFNNCKQLWQSIFGKYYRDKYQHGTGLSGGGIMNKQQLIFLLKTDILKFNQYRIDSDLSYTDLTDADLIGENLTDADLRGANLRGADLRGAKGVQL